MALSQYEAYLPNYIDNKIASVIGDAPTNLNTLGKIANVLGNDINFNSNLQNQLNNKQDVITDGSLSISKIAGLDTQMQNMYTKSAVDGLLTQKQSFLADGSVSMSKIMNLQTGLDKKATLISPVFRGTPLAPSPEHYQQLNSESNH